MVAKEILDFLGVMEEFCELHKDTVEVNAINRSSTFTSVASFRELESFYELNSDTSHGIKDKRLHIFLSLKKKALNLIKFLSKRTTCLTQSRKKRVPKKRKPVTANIRPTLYVKMKEIKPRRWVRLPKVRIPL